MFPEAFRENFLGQIIWHEDKYVNLNRKLLWIIVKEGCFEFLMLLLIHPDAKHFLQYNLGTTHINGKEFSLITFTLKAFQNKKLNPAQTITLLKQFKI